MESQRVRQDWMTFTFTFIHSSKGPQHSKSLNMWWFISVQLPWPPLPTPSCPGAFALAASPPPDGHRFISSLRLGLCASFMFPLLLSGVLRPRPPGRVWSCLVDFSPAPLPTLSSDFCRVFLLLVTVPSLLCLWLQQKLPKARLLCISFMPCSLCLSGAQDVLFAQSRLAEWINEWVNKNAETSPCLFIIVFYWYNEGGIMQQPINDICLLVLGWLAN